MTKILDSFASNFQKGGIPFLIFFGFLCYVAFRVIRSIVPEEETPELKAEKEIQDSVANQSGVKDAITTQDKIIANRLYDLCNSWNKFNEAEVLKCAEYFTSATITKRVFVAYGMRDISILWFSPESKNLVDSVLDKYGTTGSGVGAKFYKIFANANLS